MVLPFACQLQNMWQQVMALNPRIIKVRNSGSVFLCTHVCPFAGPSQCSPLQ